MIALLDTHLLLWAAYRGRQLSPAASALLADESNEFVFSATSIWESAIKAKKRPDTFLVDPSALRMALLRLAFKELHLTSEHGAATAKLPLLHRDPFDRILVAQALVEGLTLVTADRQLTLYDVPVLFVG